MVITLWQVLVNNMIVENKKMKILLVLISLLYLCGCVGLAVGSYGTFETAQENSYVSGKLKQQSANKDASYSKEQVISALGQPDKTSTNGSCDVLSYHDGYNWAGVGAFVGIVPVPLVIPNGHNETKIYFKNNQSVQSTSEYGEITWLLGYMCGSNECGFNAGPVNEQKTRKVLVTWCD